jgi:glycosyltransferase involved in cell wall biosynthesis
VGARLFDVARVVARTGVGILALPGLVALALTERVRTTRRRRRGERPRLLWGPVPIISIKYWSAAMRELGYESRTCVFDVYPINARDDFDHHYDEFLRPGLALDLVRAYAVFAWALRVADVHVTFLDGGFLRGTALKPVECWLLRLGSKKLVVSPYGSDIAVPGHLGATEAPVLRDYPLLADHADATRRRVLHFCRWADVVIRNFQPGFLPRHDVVWGTMIGIDIEQWRSREPPSDADGHRSEVVIVHAPNHRHVKATNRFLEAVEKLRSEGLAVRVDLLEGRPNREVREAVIRCDVVAEQFIAGYALFAIEGLAAGRPVLSALSGLPSDFRESQAIRDCPIVDTDVTNLQVNIRQLAEDPALRRELGRAGRAYALRYHSYEAVGLTWVAIIDHAWTGAPLPAELLPGSTGARP